VRDSQKGEKEGGRGRDGRGRDKGERPERQGGEALETEGGDLPKRLAARATAELGRLAPVTADTGRLVLAPIVLGCSTCFMFDGAVGQPTP